METQRIIVISAIVAMCIAVLMSGYFTRIKNQGVKRMKDTAHRDMPSARSDINSQTSSSQSQKKEGNNNKGKKKNWAKTMLPFYSLGIIAYVLFVVGKIMSKKYSDVRKNDHVKLSWNKQQRSTKGKAKTKITMHELRQLEDKLQETEKAVQEIFSRACDAMSATQKTLDRYPSTSATNSENEETANRNKTRLKKGVRDQEIFGIKRVRRIKRSIRDRSKAAAPYMLQESSSDDECVSPMNTRDGRGKISDSSLLTQPPNQQENNEELMETANSIRKTMSELQVYLDDKKAELSGD
uniref:protein RIC-3-like isoform X2 n=1 Tax=Styela clava TaxID=7725 RepID=UPI00193A0C23|nr:protein RIC-3-like isoform X2 [Styela clava]